VVGATVDRKTQFRGVHHPWISLQFFRNLNVFVRNKKRFELKVLAVLLQSLWAKPQEDLRLLRGVLWSQSRSRASKGGRRRSRRSWASTRSHVSIRSSRLMRLWLSVVDNRSTFESWLTRIRGSQSGSAPFTHKDHTERAQVST